MKRETKIVPKTVAGRELRRAQKGRSLGECSRAWGYPVTTLRHWIGGTRTPKAETIKALEDTLGISPSAWYEEA